jgi:RHS repeat-associated protein
VFARAAADGSAAWYLTDRLGTVRDVVDGGGVLRDHRDYSGFGVLLTETGAAWGDRYSFAGREHDAVTGLDNNRARNNRDPRTGRFNSEDPSGFASGDANPYRYAGNRPTNATDPSGLELFAFGGKAKDDLLKDLRGRGVTALALELGDYKHPTVGKQVLWLIKKVGDGPNPKAAKGDDIEKALQPGGPNKLYYYEVPYPNTLQSIDLDANTLRPEQRITIFGLNSRLYGAGAGGSIGVADVAKIKWKDASLEDLLKLYRVRYKEEADKLLPLLAQTHVAVIHGPVSDTWWTNYRYRNGTLTLFDRRRNYFSGPFFSDYTLEDAARHLHEALFDNKESMLAERGTGSRYDPQAYAGWEDVDPTVRLHGYYSIFGEVGLNAGFDMTKDKAAEWAKMLMWHYAGAAFFAQPSGLARALGEAKAGRVEEMLEAASDRTALAEGKAAKRQALGECMEGPSSIAKSFTQKQRLPADGTWKNADGTLGLPGESFWHSPDPKLPPVRYQRQFPVFTPHNGIEVKIRMTGLSTDPETDFRAARETFGNMLKNNPELRKRLGVPDTFIFKNREINGEVIKTWMEENQLTWHHHQDMQTMQLVEKSIHEAAKHTGGQAYAQAVTKELIKRGFMTDKRAGLTPELIRKARELGIIPADFP